MATWDDVRRLTAARPKTSERASRGLPRWRATDTLVMWGRPLRQRDRDEVGENAPGGPILATLEEPLTEAWLARAPKSLSRAYLDTPA